MIERQHPILGSSTFLMKRWKKHTIYAKRGSYVRTKYLKSGSYGWDGKENVAVDPTKDIAYNRTNAPHNGVYFEEPSLIKDNLYQTASVWLYDYVTVSQAFYFNYVYTASLDDQVPSFDKDFVTSVNLWTHRDGTWKNSPNAILSNYMWHPQSFPTYPNYVYPLNTYASTVAGHPVYGYAPEWYSGIPFGDPNYQTRMKTPQLGPDDTYFEIVKGYPRNHFTHKRQLFSLFAFNTVGLLHRTFTGSLAPRIASPLNPERMDITRSFYADTGSYVRNRQTTTTTVGQDSLEDGTPPVQSFQVGNLKLVQTDNVINH